MSFVARVSEKFVEESKREDVLKPEEYTAFADWEKRSIPFEVVSTSLEAYFGRPAKEKEFRLGELEALVLENFRQWLRTG